MFVGTPSNADLDHAIYMQAARSEYEIDLCQVTLHAKLRRIGWGYEGIMAAVLNPATLTDCVYLSDWRVIDLWPPPFPARGGRSLWAVAASFAARPCARFRAFSS